MEGLRGLLVDDDLGQVMLHLAFKLVLDLLDGIGGELVGLLQGLDAGDVILDLLHEADKVPVGGGSVDCSPSLEDLINSLVGSSMLCVKFVPAVLHGELVGNSGLVVLVQETLLFETKHSILLLLVGDMQIKFLFEPDIVNFLARECGWRKFLEVS